MGSVFDHHAAHGWISVRAAVLFCLSFCTVLLAVAGWELVSHYQREFEAAEARTRATGIVVGEWLQGAFQTADYLLQGIVLDLDPEALQYPHPDPVAQAQRTELLRQLKAILPEIDDIGLFNAQGLLTHATSDEEPLGFDASHRPFFNAYKTDPTLDRFTSGVFWSETAHSYKVAQTRPVRYPDGDFAGVVGIRHDLSLFDQWLDRIELLPGGSLTVVDDRTVVIARRPPMPDMVGQALDEDILRALHESDRHVVHDSLHSPIDGVHRLFSAHKVDDLPFVVVVGEAKHVFLADWRRKLWGYAFGWLCITALALMTLRAYLRLGESASALHTGHRQLQCVNAALEREIAERQRTEAELRFSEARFRRLFQDIPAVAIQGYGRDGVITFWNRASEGLYGYSAEQAVGRKLTELVIPPDQRAAFDRTIRDMADTGQPLPELELIVQRKDGTLVTVLSHQTVVQPTGHDPEIFCMDFDLTERKRTEAKLRIAAITFEAQEGMFVTDAETVILRVNRAFTEITGYTIKEAIGRTPRLLRSGHHDEAFYRDMWQTIERTGAWQGEIWNRRKNSEVYPQWLTITAVKDDTDTVTHYVATLTDITERKAAEERIRQLAFYDPLTGLPNRCLLLDRLQYTLTASRRKGHRTGVLFIDLDNFKTLNDTRGHDQGDRLLQQVAQRLSGCVRAEDTVARLGGDEFVIMLVGLGQARDAAAAQATGVGEKILVALARPYDLGDYAFHCTGSIGITVSGGNESGPEELMKQADRAMYQAKQAGRNTLRVVRPEVPSLSNAVVVE